jgi:hypothetical protein
MLKHAISACIAKELNRRRIDVVSLRRTIACTGAHYSLAA